MLAFRLNKQPALSSHLFRWDAGRLIQLSHNTNSSHHDFMKASVIDGFPNEFKQRGFKAGIFFPLVRVKWRMKTKHTIAFEPGKKKFLYRTPGTKKFETSVSLHIPFPLLSLPPVFPSIVLEWSTDFDVNAQCLLAHGAEGLLTPAFTFFLFNGIYSFVSQAHPHPRASMCGTFEEVI